MGNLNVVELPAVFPKFTIRQVVTTVNVWDNQTVVLGGLITSTVNSTKDKVPVIGDIPLAGRLFQSQSKITAKNNLMIFVTATIVDPAGFRVHSDDELPFAQTGVPVQPAENVPPDSHGENLRRAGQDHRRAVNRLLIVDGHAYAYRAFHAIRDLRGPEGRPTNAIYGFIKMLDKLRATLAPAGLIVVWDGGLSAERMTALPEYKSASAGDAG